MKTHHVQKPVSSVVRNDDHCGIAYFSNPQCYTQKEPPLFRFGQPDGIFLYLRQEWIQRWLMGDHWRLLRARWQHTYHKTGTKPGLSMRTWPHDRERWVYKTKRCTKPRGVWKRCPVGIIFIILCDITLQDTVKCTHLDAALAWGGQTHLKSRGCG